MENRISRVEDSIAEIDRSVKENTKINQKSPNTKYLGSLGSQEKIKPENKWNLRRRRIPVQRHRKYI